MDVLVAHGGEASRRALSQALQGRGLQVIEVCDGAEALQRLLQPGAPRLALVDWDLPGMDALEFCRLARQYDGSGPLYVIVLTRAGLGRDPRVALEAGANDCVQTPVSGDELRERVELGRRFVELPWWRAATKAAPGTFHGGGGLPGVCDREAILRRLEEELARAKRHDVELSIALLSVDGLDRTAGHPGAADDPILLELTRRLRATLRPYDAVGRVGDAQFLIVVPGTDEDDARTVLGRLYRAVESQPFTREDGHTVRVFLGGATGLEEAAEVLVVRAQEALDEAREQGSDRVVAGRKVELAAVLRDECQTF
jgi:diguanylate cyclase (GGDEF)-like protein